MSSADEGALDPDEGSANAETELSRRSPPVEGEGATHGEAKWAAMKALERKYPGVNVTQVNFEVVEERQAAGEQGFAKVVAVVDLLAWRGAEREFEWPDEPGERVREILRRITAHLGVRASIDVEERDDELRAAINGPELGLLIGKHGQTIDAAQFLCGHAAYRGHEERKRVTVDAGGYRERREAGLHRQADHGVANAIRYGRPVELDSMMSEERKVVHTYLQDNPEVETHSEGDEPFRRIVITPLRTRGEA